MKKIKVAFCAMLFALTITVSNYGQFGPVCRDGQTPIVGKCSDGYPPGLVASGTVTTNDKTTFEEFFNWVRSLF